MKAEILNRQGAEVGQVFDDRDAGSQKHGVHRAASVCGVVDVEGVYADKLCALVAEVHGNSLP